jgi:hypothetical protein
VGIINRGANAAAHGGACCAPQVLGRGAQADARGAAQVFGRVAQADARGAACCASQVLSRGAQAAARGAARCLSQVFDPGAQAVARGAARCLLQVLDRDAQVVARGAATLPQQEKNKSEDLLRSRVNFFALAIHTAVFVHVLVLLAAGFALCFGESINLTWQSKFYRLHLCSGKATLAVMHLR